MASRSTAMLRRAAEPRPSRLYVFTSGQRGAFSARRLNFCCSNHDLLGLPSTSKTRRFEDLFYEDVIGVWLIRPVAVGLRNIPNSSRAPRFGS